MAAVGILSVATGACGSDDKSADDSSVATLVDTDDTPIETMATVADPHDEVETTSGAVDEPGNPETSYPDTSEADDPTGSTETSDSSDDSDPSGDGHTSDDLQEYIDSLAATTDNFDALTTTPEETSCAATAILTPLGVELLQREGVTVENVDQELNILALTTAESAVGIADGLVGCGLGPRFASSLGEAVVAEDLDQAGHLALRACVQAQLDDSTARALLIGLLTPSTEGSPDSPEQADAAAQMTDIVRGCGVEVTATS